MSDCVKPKAAFCKWAIVVLIVAILAALIRIGINDPVIQRAAIIAAVCLTLWLSEIVPAFVPTFILWGLTPVLLQTLSDHFRLTRVLAWSAEPVLVLFLGGFTLGAAAKRYGIDRWIANWAVRFSQGSQTRLLFLAAGATAVLSMWMSNIAAAAMMLAALRPIISIMPEANRFRRGILVGVALGANFGGMATPIGTGPNAIAIAEISSTHTISFLSWMSFAVPLTVGMLVVGLMLLIAYFGVNGSTKFQDTATVVLTPKARWIVGLFFATVVLWLAEPLHGVSSAVIALSVTAVLFGSGLLGKDDLANIDWSTLILIAGGIGLGRLFEQSGLVQAAAAKFPWAQASSFVVIFTLCFASALLSALMSNTGTAAMLIPLGLTLCPHPSTAILVAIAASFGIPFVISTPPNAMVYGEGGVKTTDLLWPGLVLMIVGCILVSLTGPHVLHWIGIP